jgi:hypothetical protein
MITEAEKSDLSRSSWTYGTSREVLFAREVFTQGMDYLKAAEYGISKLHLNKNALNTAYNQVSKTVGLKYL